jgi:hypothetical protein
MTAESLKQPHGKNPLLLAHIVFPLPLLPGQATRHLRGEEEVKIRRDLRGKIEGL